jgi:hypothetical protein
VEDDERSCRSRSHRTDEIVKNMRSLALKLTLKYQSCGCATKFRKINSGRGLNIDPMIGFSKALSVKQFLAGKLIEMECSPHSPNLAPNGFWLFKRIKPALKG